MPRQTHASVPTEIMRSVVGIAEEGSISRAARTLGISQPAISAQLKRIEDYVGGSIFHKSAHGSSVTELGKVVLIQARKILEANNQLQLLRGNTSANRSPRVGISDLYASRALADLPIGDFADVSIVADNSTEIVKGLINGFIDIGMFLQPAGATLDPSIMIVKERPDELVWVRSSGFVLSPGAPIPLLTWSGQITHHVMIHTLERCGMIYRIAFSSPDHQAHLEAARRGLGITALPRCLVPPTLMPAREYYLPPLATPTLYLGVRAGFDFTRSKFVASLSKDFFELPA